MDDGKSNLGEEATDVKKDKINAIWAQLNAKKETPTVGRNAGVPFFGVASKPVKQTETSNKSASAVPTSIGYRHSRKDGRLDSLIRLPTQPLQSVACGRRLCSELDLQSWMVNLGIAPKKPSSVTDNIGKTNQPLSIEDILKKQETSSSIDTGKKQESASVEDQEAGSEDVENEDARKIAAAALASAKAATKASTDGKMEINEVRDFAGEEVRITKFVDPNSKAAVAARKRAEMQAASSSGLDALLQQIGKKQKLNILDKSRKDWGEFKEDKGIEVELEMHKKSGDTYTEKVAFLQRADVREYERERDARLALQSKRRNESGSLE
ncbi:hypothetical protein AXG93_230s1040 [Marchantia polymorpha subsp. ruderalis]|uniref:BCNT-C domain-containing protein n=1 Tax=Marchantia polymorpha subsp. ruderalis TaxID=1480154 RepID=A0A176WNE8_MARPO|nr:hypothetical protein AXG93_230s1040 [Marchantia polymorpha subsp. ruderalis]